MKRLLIAVICFCSLFILVSCKKNEPVGRTTENFLSDFYFEDDLYFNRYDEIIKDMSINNRLSQIGTMPALNFKPNKKVIIKKISFTIYNYSTDKVFSVFQKEDNYFNFLDDNYLEINAGDEKDKIIKVNSDSSIDIELVLDTTVKKNCEIILGFGFVLNPEIIGGTFIDNVNTLKDSAGLCNFKVEYVAYMKI